MRSKVYFRSLYQYIQIYMRQRQDAQINIVLQLILAYPCSLQKKRQM
jgi:hypothetical protein